MAQAQNRTCRTNWASPNYSFGQKQITSFNGQKVQTCLRENDIPWVVLADKAYIKSKQFANEVRILNRKKNK